jgi:hypothetical protein
VHAGGKARKPASKNSRDLPNATIATRGATAGSTAGKLPQKAMRAGAEAPALLHCKRDKLVAPRKQLGSSRAAPLASLRSCSGPSGGLPRAAREEDPRDRHIHVQVAVGVEEPPAEVSRARQRRTPRGAGLKDDIARGRTSLDAELM